MITEESLVNYFTDLAKKHPALRFLDPVDNRKSFIYIENSYDLEELDKSLRNNNASPVLLLMSDDGVLTDNNSENFLQKSEAEFLILGNAINGKTPRAVRQQCLGIILSFITRIRKDARTAGEIVPDKHVRFRIDDVPYSKVGPICLTWYGYLVKCQFICPFDASVKAGTWTDN